MSDAAVWIGQSQPNDTLDLTGISGELPAEAKILKGILEDPAVAGLDTIRKDASRAAKAAQRRFRVASIAAVLGTAVATLASGLLLYGAGSEATAGEPPIQQSLVSWVTNNRTIITVVQVLGLFTTTVSTTFLGLGNYLAKWTDNRRQAEIRRREIFIKTLDLAARQTPASIDAPAHGNPVRLALEFFRRYQLELQIGFYGRAGSRQGSSAGILIWVTAILAGIAAVSGAIGSLGGTAVVVSAFLGLSVPVLLSAAQSWRAATRNTDTASAYEKTRRALQEVALDLTEVRQSADLGDTAVVRAYFDRANLVMASENESWVPAEAGAAGN